MSRFVGGMRRTSGSNRLISIRAREIFKKVGPIAQFRLERTPDKREVTGSTPVRPTAKA